MDLLGNHSGAVFSDCRRYRYRLWRVWDEALPRAVFIMMNPSTADEVENDPTIERCQRRVAALAQSGELACGGIEVVNVFAWRETVSARLAGLYRSGADIIGPANDMAILEATEGAAIIVCAWGSPAALGERGNAVVKLLRGAGRTLHALKFNGDGSPGHPLYVGYAVKPRQWLP